MKPPKIDKKLQFLVRNWPIDDDYPWNKGSKYMDDVLKVNEKDPPEVAAVRKSLKNAFSVLQCKLLPYPGPIVAGYKRSKEPMKISDIDDDFKKETISFFCELFERDNLQLKKSNGTKLKGFDIMNFVCSYFKLFKDGKFSDPINIVEAAEIASAQTIVTNIMEDYNQGMTQVLTSAPYIEERHLNLQHNRHKRRSISLFDEKCQNFEMERVFKTYKASLDSEIQKSFVYHSQCRKAKEEEQKNKFRRINQRLFCKYGSLINKASSENQLEDLKRRVLSEYESSVRNDIQTVTNLKEEFSQELKTFLSKAIAERMKTLNAEQECSKEVGKYITIYKEAIQGELKDNCVTGDVLKDFHSKLKREVLDKVREDEQQNDPLSSNYEAINTELKSAIDREFNEIETVNQIRLDGETDIFMARLEHIKQEHLGFLERETKGVYLKPETLRAIHNKFIDSVKEEQSEWGGNEYYENLKEIELNTLEEQYSVFEKNMEKRKQYFRESNNGASFLAEVLKGMIPKLVLDIFVDFVTRPGSIFKNLGSKKP